MVQQHTIQHCVQIIDGITLDTLAILVWFFICRFQNVIYAGVWVCIYITTCKCCLNAVLDKLNHFKIHYNVDNEKHCRWHILLHDNKVEISIYVKCMLSIIHTYHQILYRWSCMMFTMFTMQHCNCMVMLCF